MGRGARRSRGLDAPLGGGVRRRSPDLLPPDVVRYERAGSRLGYHRDKGILYHPRGSEIPTLEFNGHPRYPVIVPSSMTKLADALIWIFVEGRRRYNVEDLADTLWRDYEVGVRQMPDPGHVKKNRKLTDADLRFVVHEWAGRMLIPVCVLTDENGRAHFRLAESREEGVIGAKRVAGYANSYLRALKGMRAWLKEGGHFDADKFNTSELEARWGAENVEKALDLIKAGGAKGKELQAELGWGGSRVREFVHSARLAGAPILADTNGYSWAKQRSEVEDYLRRGVQRHNAIRQTAERLMYAVNLWYPDPANEAAVENAKKWRSMPEPMRPLSESENAKRQREDRAWRIATAREKREEKRKPYRDAAANFVEANRERYAQAVWLSGTPQMTRELARLKTEYEKAKRYSRGERVQLTKWQRKNYAWAPPKGI